MSSETVEGHNNPSEKRRKFPGCTHYSCSNIEFSGSDVTVKFIEFSLALDLYKKFDYGEHDPRTS